MIYACRKRGTFGYQMKLPRPPQRKHALAPRCVKLRHDITTNDASSPHVSPGRVEGTYQPSAFRSWRRWYLGRLNSAVHAYFLVFNQ